MGSEIKHKVQMWFHMSFGTIPGIAVALLVKRFWGASLTTCVAIVFLAEILVYLLFIALVIWMNWRRLRRSQSHNS